MNRYLIILLGANYVNPMIVFGDIDNIIKNLSNESTYNEYIYAIYTINDKYDIYVPYGVIYHGYFSSKEGCRIDGIRIAR